jgi:hypothetical protein
MTEWALAVSRPGDLEPDALDARLALAPTARGHLGDLQAETRAAMARAFGPIRFSRLYFGNEFCERLIPGAADLRRAAGAAAARGLGLTFLTPYVTDAGLERLRPALDLLAARPADGVEVVANDWGLVHLLRRDYPSLRLVLGRLMNRMLRDPRVTHYLASAPAPEEAHRALRQSGVTAPIFRRFLARLGVERVEFDHLPQGLDMDFRQLGLAASLYLPYGYIATGRVCMIGSLHLPAAEKFDVESICRKECHLYTFSFEYSNSPYDNRDQEFLEKGNTYFFHQDAGMIASAAELVERLGIGRIVFESGLPM